VGWLMVAALGYLAVGCAFAGAYTDSVVRETGMSRRVAASLLLMLWPLDVIVSNGGGWDKT